MQGQRGGALLHVQLRYPRWPLIGGFGGAMGLWCCSRSVAVTDEALDGQPAIFDGAWWLLAALGATIAWADLSLLLFFFL